jgi:Mg-chelatase subunit ChlD
MFKYTSLTNINALYRYAVYLAGKVGMKVEFFKAEPGKQPYSTKGSIHLPLVSTMTVEAEQNLRFYVLHECAHIGIGPEIFELVERELPDMKHPVAIISNILEDYRIERVAAHAFKGDKAIIDIGRVNLLASETAMLDGLRTKHGATFEFEPDTARFASIGAMTKVFMCEYLPEFSTVLPAHVAMYPASATAYMDILISKNFYDRCCALDSAHDTWALSKDVYAWLWDKSPEEVEEEMERERSKPKTGEPSEDGDEGEPCSDGEPGENPGDGEPGDITGKKLVKIPWQVIAGSDHLEGKGTPSSIDWGEGAPASDWVPYPPDKVDVIIPEPRYSHHIPKTGTSPAFKNKVRQWMQAKAAVSYDTGFKSGSLRAGQLWRGGIPAVGNAEWNQRVFRKPGMDTELDSAVLVLVDYSGSMCGDKHEVAAAATSHLTEVLRCVQVPVAVLGFTDSTCCQVLQFKKFSESISEQELMARLAGGADHMCGNSDADAVLYAHRYLTDNISAKRKVLIVLSDGSPTDAYIHPGTRASGITLAAAGLKRVVKEFDSAFLTGKSNIEMVGVGVLDGNVRHFYDKHVVLDNLESLEPTLLGIVKRSLV